VSDSRAEQGIHSAIEPPFADEEVLLGYLAVIEHELGRVGRPVPELVYLVFLGEARGV